MSGNSERRLRSNPLVSIVVLNYNGKQHLEACLDSLLRTDYPNFEIILVDNGSTDGSVEFVRKNYPIIRVLALEKNTYTTGGYMTGVLVARGKYIAILSNDMEVDRKWLKPLVKILEKAPWIVAADAKYMNFYQHNRFDDVAAAGRWVDYFGNNYTRGVNEVDVGQYDRPTYIIGVITIFRRDVLLKVGGFDLSYLYGYEDIDLGWRLYLMGYKVLYVPQSIIYHKSGATTRDFGESRPRPFFYYLNKRNRLISIIKNYSISNFLLALTITLSEYFVLLYYFFLTKRRVYGLQLFRAVCYVFANLRKIIKKRAQVQAYRVRSDKEIKRYMLPYSGIIYDLIRKIEDLKRDNVNLIN